MAARRCQSTQAWRTAQAEMDDLMQGLLGNQAFEDYQQQVLANAQRQQDQVP